MISIKARLLDTLLRKVLRQLAFHCVSRYDVRTSDKNFPVKKSTSTTTRRHFASRLIPSSTAASGFTETGGFETYLQEMLLGQLNISPTNLEQAESDHELESEFKEMLTPFSSYQLSPDSWNMFD